MYQPILNFNAGRVYHSSDKRNLTVWRPSVRLSVPSFLTLIERTAHTQQDSPGGSMRRGQRTFRPDSKEDTDILVVDDMLRSLRTVCKYHFCESTLNGDCRTQEAQRISFGKLNGSKESFT